MFVDDGPVLKQIELNAFFDFIVEHKDKLNDNPILKHVIEMRLTRLSYYPEYTFRACHYLRVLCNVRFYHEYKNDEFTQYFYYTANRKHVVLLKKCIDDKIKETTTTTC